MSAVSAVFLAAGVALLAKRPLKIGDVDPLSAVIGSMSLVAGVLSAVLANRALRSGDTDTVAKAAKLAELVEKAETNQRKQLLSRAARTIDVGFVLVSSHEVDGAASAGTLRIVVGYFRDLRPAQRLVITGAPGAGKTVLAIDLILGLLEDRKPSAPVPVRVSAAAWDPGMDVEDLLAGHLMQTFGLREVTARALVDAHLVLPVIDGLDEMDRTDEPGYDSAAGRALEKLNRYQNGRGKASVILTCRTGQYQALTRGHAQAHDAVHVDLVPVSPAQASQFITAAGPGQVPRWQPVLRALNQPGHPLTQTLTTPWRLTLAVTVYQERSTTGDYVRDPADLAAYDDPDDIHRHLLEQFIPASVANAPRNPHRYRPDQVHTWLTVLAGYLDANTGRPAFAGRALSSTDIVLHELWPILRNRSRDLTALLATLLTALPITVVLAAVAASEGGSAAAWFGQILVLLSGVIAWRHPWPVPAHLDLSRLRTPSGRRRTLKWIAIGITAGPPVGLTVGLTDWFGGYPEDALAEGFAFGLTSGLTGGLAFGLTSGLTGGLTFGLTGGLAFGLTDGLTSGLMFGLTIGLWAWAASGFTVRPAGLAAVRYLVTLVCMERRLPLRLGRFLDWCYTDAGLVRTAGIAYQFRHRELQNHLAAPERQNNTT